jgi:hypothetical protein
LPGGGGDEGAGVDLALGVRAGEAAAADAWPDGGCEEGCEGFSNASKGETKSNGDLAGAKPCGGAGAAEGMAWKGAGGGLVMLVMGGGLMMAGGRGAAPAGWVMTGSPRAPGVAFIGGERSMPRREARRCSSLCWP